MFPLLHRNRDFRAISKKRFDFLHLGRQEKEDKLLLHQALSFKKPKK